MARFNRALAEHLDVKVVPLTSYIRQPLADHVLLSIKLEEIDAETLDGLNGLATSDVANFSLLLHGTDGSDLEARLCGRSKRLFAASSEMARVLSALRSDVTAVFAPGAPVSPRKAPVDCTLLTFGMAHKIRSDGYRRLAEIIRGDSRSFRLEISTALHEGNSFDENFFEIGEEISDVFDGNVRFLGFLTDAEVSERLREVEALVAFFPRGVRENNTTVLSAMTHGCAVITNLDSESPPWMVHNETVFDVNELIVFPDNQNLRRVGNRASIAAGKFDFRSLIELLTKDQ